LYFIYIKSFALCRFVTDKLLSTKNVHLENYIFYNQKTVLATKLIDRNMLMD